MSAFGVEAVRLGEGHVGAVLALMNKEGWYYYDRAELERYRALNQDCFVLEPDGMSGKVVGSIFTTNYGNQAWIGNIVVAQQARGRGLAAGMLQGVMDHLRETAGVRTFRLGSVPLAIGLYKKAGFRAEAFTTAQEAALPLAAEIEPVRLGRSVRLERLTARDISEVAALDARYFKSNRLGLLRRLYADSLQEACFCLRDQGRLAGFLLVRRRAASRQEGGFAEGPDHAYRLGPCCVLPEHGVEGFKALVRAAVPAVNAEVRRLGGTARMYAVFPRNARKDEIYADTRKLAATLSMEEGLDLDSVFDEHEHIFAAARSVKNREQWEFMEHLGFRQEYFEQVMCHAPTDGQEKGSMNAAETMADMRGIFASATPGDKA